ncbi:heterocyst frequency control protein PatD [Nostoc sp. FACHB-152]|uniref:heterocyst frequency control protein PatD n=1 Tax=unclassified Nostoc TaxID=2593658 RepID=UPI001686CA08|nr:MULTISPECIES: heterocyst frequency control protein PatD [unclassified Nostoc]MBD2447739.1 heterocyst frequency control protein PatD [Nostoc sp. FACHB-152]MBD2467030.1 heterocyst frequency control protein PatD [Nostoc sp. FACHB-145]
MSLNCEKYQALANLLVQLNSEITANEPDITLFRQRVAQLQQLFQQEIVPLVAENSKEQSYRTEISKQLRLLEIDVMFFQGARQTATAQVRLKTIGDRLTTLLQYCHAILQQETPGEIKD